MKLTYAVSLNDFRGLQAPFTVRAGSNAGFKGAMVFCALLATLGVWTLIQGMGLPVGGFLIGLAALASVCAYAYDKKSVGRAKQQHESRILSGYQAVHCRDQRVFEINTAGFTAACACGTVTRPWSELTHVSGNEKFIFVGSKTGVHPLPKSYFPSAGEITEFRAFLAEQLHQDKLPTARNIKFACTKSDFRNAKLLHLLHGGGWRGLATELAVLAGVGYGAWILWHALKHPEPAILCGIVGPLVGVTLLRLTSRKRKANYYGPLQIDFSDEGMHLRDPNTQARSYWSQYVGYLENENVLLLYRTPMLYRIIPKRALIEQGTEFLKLVETKLRPFDYRTPLSPPLTGPTS